MGFPKKVKGVMKERHDNPYKIRSSNIKKRQLEYKH